MSDIRYRCGHWTGGTRCTSNACVIITSPLQDIYEARKLGNHRCYEHALEVCEEYREKLDEKWKIIPFGFFRPEWVEEWIIENRRNSPEQERIR